MKFPNLSYKCPFSEVTGYHGTPRYNVAFIEEQGIVPRKPEGADALVDSILAEHGLTRKDVPEWVWKYPKLRWEETANRVYITGDKQYAIGNCRAGLEAEGDLRLNIRSWVMRRKRKKAPQTYESVMEMPPCFICKLRIPISDIDPRDMEEFAGRIERVKGYLQEKGLPASDRDAWEFLFSQVTYTVPKVPPENILSCDPVPPKDGNSEISRR